MSRIAFLSSLVAGAVATTAVLGGNVSAQPAPPAPPAPPAQPAQPRTPKAPKPPKRPKIKVQVGAGSNLPDSVRREMQRGLDEAIAELEDDDDMPAAIKRRVLDSLKKARASGNPGDLVDLMDLDGLGADLSAQINDDVQRAMEEARRAGDEARRAMDEARRAAARGHGRVTIDPGSGDPWSWSWDDDASPFDDPDMDWLRGVPFSPFGPDVPSPPDPPDFDDMDLDLDLDLDLDFDVDDVQLDAGKITALQKIAADEEKATRPAQREVERLGKQLRRVVSGPNPNQAEIDRLVDSITAEEAKIRKARLGALTQTRKVLGK